MAAMCSAAASACPCQWRALPASPGTSLPIAGGVDPGCAGTPHVQVRRQEAVSVGGQTLQTGFRRSQVVPPRRRHQGGRHRGGREAPPAPRPRCSFLRRRCRALERGGDCLGSAGSPKIASGLNIMHHDPEADAVRPSLLDPALGHQRQFVERPGPGTAAGDHECERPRRVRSCRVQEPVDVQVPPWPAQKVSASENAGRARPPSATSRKS